MGTNLSFPLYISMYNPPQRPRVKTKPRLMNKSCICLCILGAFLAITVVVALICGYYYCSQASSEIDLEGQRLKELEQKRIREQKERVKEEARREAFAKACRSQASKVQRSKPGKN